MITPTVGRIVLYYPGESADEQPLPAIVCAVRANDSIVNLAVFGPNGAPLGGGIGGVRLIQPEDPTPLEGHFCKWMPYQIGKAAEVAPAAPPVGTTPVPAG